MIRKEIRRFAKAIEQTMRRNDHVEGKGDTWKSCSRERLWTKLYEEYLESIKADRHAPGFVREELLDLATVAMFLWHRYEP